MSREIDYERALDDPAAQFAGPEDVLIEPGLTTKQKVEILRRWEYEECEVAVAEEEGMTGGKFSMLQPIMLALERLDGGVDVEHTSPTKQHGMSNVPVGFNLRKPE